MFWGEFVSVDKLQNACCWQPQDAPISLIWILLIKSVCFPALLCLHPVLLCCCSVVQSRPTLWDPLDYSMPGFPCPSLSPGACSNASPSSRWCHPTISSSLVLFSSCPQSFPALGFFLMSWLFASGGQSIGASASGSVLPMNIQGWFPLGLSGLMSLPSKGLSVWISVLSKLYAM